MPDENVTLAQFCSATRVQNLSDWKTYCRHNNISRQVPLNYAIPLYGYALPAIVAVTVVTNSFIVIVLAQKHLRTPTNFVLLAMAIAELGTGLVSLPWFIYYYTLKGYLVDEYQGLPTAWCASFPFLAFLVPTICHTAAIWLTVYLAVQSFPFLAFLVPTICHTAAIWLTVYLAVQRYVYVCVPTLVPIYCTRGRTRFFIATIFVAAILAELPKILSGYNRSHTVEYEEPADGRWYQRSFCIMERSEWLVSLGPTWANYYFASFYIFQAMFVHIIPCLTMALFTAILICAIRNADRRRKKSLFRQRNGGRVKLDGMGGTTSCMRYFHSTTQMLVVVILIFLATEIPVAVIFLLHFLIQTQHLSGRHYSWINSALIFRNVLILVSYPFNFAIYCGMSQQFRLTVRQLFTRQALFVQQPVPAFPRGGKRYSVVLVDIQDFKQPVPAFPRGGKRYSAVLVDIQDFKKTKMGERMRQTSSRIKASIARSLSLRTSGRDSPQDPLELNRLRVPESQLLADSNSDLHSTDNFISSSALITVGQSSPSPETRHEGLGAASYCPSPVPPSIAEEDASNHRIVLTNGLHLSDCVVTYV